MWATQQMMITYWARPVTYATRNPSDKHADVVLSNGNLTMECTTNNWRSVRATIWKWYREITQTTTSNPYWVRWVWNISSDLSQRPWMTVNGWDWYYDWASVLKYHSAVPVSFGTASSSWNVLWFALDMWAWTLEVYKNNVYQWIMYSWITWTIYPIVSVYWTWPKQTANFWATTMTYTAPSWFNQWLYS